MFRKTFKKEKEEKIEKKDEGSIPTSPVSGNGEGAVSEVASAAPSPCATVAGSGGGASGAVSEGQSERGDQQCDNGEAERKVPSSLPVKQDKPKEKLESMSNRKNRDSVMIC